MTLQQLYVFIATLLSAIASWGCYLTAEFPGKIDALLRTAHRYEFPAIFKQCLSYLTKLRRISFTKYNHMTNCLNSILPEEK